MKTNKDYLLEDAIQIWNGNGTSPMFEPSQEVFAMKNRAEKENINSIYGPLVTYIDTEAKFIDTFGKPDKCSPGISYYEPDINYVPPTPMSTDDIRDKLIADLDQERHDMIDVMREKETRASDFKFILLSVWNDLCDAYDNNRWGKEISKATLFGIYNLLEKDGELDMSRDFVKKIKKEIERTEIKNEFQGFSSATLKAMKIVDNF